VIDDALSALRHVIGGLGSSDVGGAQLDRIRTGQIGRHMVSAGWEDQAMAIEALDVLYVPSRDVEADVEFYRDVLGARVVFAIEAMGTRVAEVAISSNGPRLVLADHLAGDAPVLLHRVSDLDETLAEFSGRGLRLERRLELPLGPGATFRSPGGQRVGLYQLTRPEVDEHFAGRADF
jgi:catechol 2,3-dioxygenase-like lactoylglutathione lyase family enzyme